MHRTGSDPSTLAHWEQGERELQTPHARENTLA